MDYKEKEGSPLKNWGRVHIFPGEVILVPKVNLISLGCPKNLVDSERILGQLEVNGYQVVDQAHEADLIIINTCGFIQEAKEESIETILNVARLKEEGTCKALIVVGCLAQRYRVEIEKELPEVDLVLGIDKIPQITYFCDRILKRRSRTTETWGFRHLMTPPHYAYLRIADGCDNRCSYCAIPLIRGRQRSRSIEALYMEARKLVDMGVQELILVAQDTTRYGVDLYGEPRLVELLTELSKVNGLRWIRLLYTHPAHWNEQLIDLIAENEKICKYVDVPVQHISDELLGLMNRKTTKKEVISLIEKLRSRIPGITLRTSVIVGFPGEEDRHFEELIEFIRDVRFDRLGAFVYSQEEDTPAARFGGQVPDGAKRERFQTLMEVQQHISAELNRSMVGKVLEVLIDERRNGFGFMQPLLIGRAQRDAPDVDGQVFITAGQASPGEFVDVEITEAYEYDLVGEIAT